VNRRRPPTPAALSEGNSGSTLQCHHDQHGGYKLRPVTMDDQPVHDLDNGNARYEHSTYGDQEDLWQCLCMYP